MVSLLAAILVAGSVSVGSGGAAWADEIIGPSDGSVDVTRQQPSPRRLDVTGLANAWEVTSDVFSGGEPQGKRAFAALARLGVATIVSVDGARPAVELARAREMRYVHIPVGYDGLEATATAALARVARECERPIYVHCHHGRHRGPAAAVVLAMSDSDGEFDVAAAVRAMQIIGTSPQYRGLWQAVRSYERPAGDDLLAELPELAEVAEVDDLAAAMARLDRAWDRVLLCQQAGWQPPPGQMDMSPRHEALLLLEALREATRVVSSQTDDEQAGELRAAFERAGTAALSLRAAISAKNRQQADDSIDRLRRSCRDCHEVSRN